MYNNFDYRELERANQEMMAKLYKESFTEQEEVDEEEVNETYCKIRKILNCPEMEKCHPFLYSLDMENVNETDTEKVNRLYNLGLERGVIQEEEKEKISDDGLMANECDDYEDGAICGGPKDSLTGQEMNTQPIENKSIFTVLYSGMKDGGVKMGEFYSVAPTMEGAKEECVAALTNNGYNSINIMAVEQTTPAINTDIDDGSFVNSLEGGECCDEDDSEEYLKQETGDNSDDIEKEENTETKEKSEDNTEEEKKEDTENSEDSSTENTEEKDTTTDDENKEEKEKDSEESEENKEEQKEEPKKLTPEEKDILRVEYTKIFKDCLKTLKLEKSVSEMSLQERTDFYTKLAEKWTKNDPSEFLDDKEQDKLNKIVVKEK